MCQLVESIRIKDGKACNLKYHQKRIYKTRSKLFNISTPINLQRLIYENLTPNYKKGIVKCRVIYTRNELKLEFALYQPKAIDKLKVVFADDTLDYPYKYVERPQLDNLFLRREKADEIIILKQNLLTDGYYYNIVISYGNKLFTPKSPLLKGTMRQKLIENQKIIELDIDLEMLLSSEKIYLINAMNPLGKIYLNPSDLEF